MKDNYFKTWNHNMAYILGVYYACGNPHENFFDITIHKKDKYLLKQIANELGYEGDQIKDNICFPCEVIYKDIISLGGLERQSIPKMPEEYLPDFIRGYFDVNGAVKFLKNNRLNSGFVFKNKELALDFHRVLKEKAALGKGSYNPSGMALKFGTKDSYRLGKYMYQDDIKLFLLRKKEKFH